jgi:hypothetical protein
MADCLVKTKSVQFVLALSKWIRDPGGGTTIRIARFSVQEYLKSERILEHAAIFSVKRPKANAEIASICLTYMLEPALSRESIAEYPFALYAAKTWHEHFRDAGESTHGAEH